MSTVYTSTDAALRRECRRQKILNNAAERISMILAGPDGKEQRPAPATEIGFSPDSMNTSSVSNMAPLSIFPSSPSAESGTVEINYVEPQYAERVNRQRIYICLVFGALCRFAVAAGYIRQVLPIFAALFIPLALALRQWLHAPVGAYPKHGYIVNFLLVGGWNEHLVVGIGRAVDVSWEICIDLLVVMLAYVITTIGCTVFGAFSLC